MRKLKHWYSRREYYRAVVGLVFLAVCVWVMFFGMLSNMLEPARYSIVIPDVAEASEIEPEMIIEPKVTVDTIEEKVCKLWGSDCEVAIAVMKAESQGDPSRVGDKHITFNNGTMGMSCGLFQIRILEGRPTCDQLLDEDFNMHYAYEMYQKVGWQPWSAWKNGSYLKYL